MQDVAILRSPHIPVAKHEITRVGQHMVKHDTCRAMNSVVMVMGFMACMVSVTGVFARFGIAKTCHGDRR